MTDERATVRPVTLGRLVEVTHLCTDDSIPTETVEDALDISHRRAREVVLETVRIGLLGERDVDDDAQYRTTEAGEELVAAVQDESWSQVSDILAAGSPHYRAFLDGLTAIEPAGPDAIVEYLEEHQSSSYSYNQTSVDVLGDWGERLGSVQRNAFSGAYYRAEETLPSDFARVFLETYDELEQTAGVNLRQRYLSIPRLREAICERIRCSRDEVDRALLALCQQNVGKLELSGAPIDTAAKDSTLGIKRIDLAGDSDLVSTSQSSQRVMAGVESYGKQYYYLAVHDRDITFTEDDY